MNQTDSAIQPEELLSQHYDTVDKPQKLSHQQLLCEEWV